MTVAETTVASRLVDHHFTNRGAEFGCLEHVPIASLDPVLRGLLFTDGTVTRTLEAYTLAPIHVSVHDQSEALLGAEAADQLDVAEGTPCIRRRVGMTAEGSELEVWAESYILAERLPPAFLASLGRARQGIGESMQGVRLESRRELLAFGLGSVPGWADVAPRRRALIRSYRIITQGLPALLITESFAVHRAFGGYRLAGGPETGTGPRAIKGAASRGMRT
jgi:chorismate-pyruvate lyase